MKTQPKRKRPKNKIKRVNKGDRPIEAGDLVAQGRPTEVVAENLLERAQKAEAQLDVMKRANETLTERSEAIRKDRDFWKKRYARSTQRLEAVSNKVIVRKTPKLDWWVRTLRWLVFLGIKKNL